MKLKDPSLLRQQCYVDGRWVDAESKGTFEVKNPANGELVGKMPKLSRAEVAKTIDAANAAFPAWRAKTAKERAALLRKWFELIVANADDLALIMTMEQGKPL